MVYSCPGASGVRDSTASVYISKPMNILKCHFILCIDNNHDNPQKIGSGVGIKIFALVWERCIFIVAQQVLLYSADYLLLGLSCRQHILM
jgi:hypothetical protein